MGWKEIVSFPEWGVVHMTAKIDSGARSSALDVKEIEELPGNRVSFRVLMQRKGNKLRTQQVVCPIMKRKWVKSSNGVKSERLVVHTMVRVGNHEKEIDISLVCRKRMLCRLLLGRSALLDEFLINPSKKYMVGPKKKPKKHRITVETQS